MVKVSFVPATLTSGVGTVVFMIVHLIPLFSLRHSFPRGPRWEKSDGFSKLAGYVGQRTCCFWEGEKLWGYGWPQERTVCPETLLLNQTLSFNLSCAWLQMFVFVAHEGVVLCIWNPKGKTFLHFDILLSSQRVANWVKNWKNWSEFWFVVSRPLNKPERSNL